MFFHLLTPLSDGGDGRFRLLTRLRDGDHAIAIPRRREHAAHRVTGVGVHQPRVVESRAPGLGMPDLLVGLA